VAAVRDNWNSERPQLCTVSRLGYVNPLDRAGMALPVLDEHIAQGPGGPGASPYERAKRRRQGLPNYRLVRYADDWCLAVSGTKAHAEALKEEIAGVLTVMGLRLSPEKTLITHIDEGLDFLGWRIQRHRKRGTGKYYVYVYPAKKALAAIKAKLKAWCRQEHEPAAQRPAHPSQPDAAWLDRLLQVRMLERDLQLSEVLPVETGGQVAGTQASANPVETTTPTLRHVAQRRGRGVVRPGQRQREALLLPGNEDRDTMAEHSMG
jgi:hypothetical protein